MSLLLRNLSYRKNLEVKCKFDFESEYLQFNFLSGDPEKNELSGDKSLPFWLFLFQVVSKTSNKF